VRPSHADEQLPTGDIADAAVVLAERKLEAVDVGEELALAADTLVVLGDTALGKPRDHAEARAMLEALSGAVHEVITGFVVARGVRRRSGAVRTRVRFRTLSDFEIARYVASGDADDKAGAYAIQGEAGAFVDRVEGSYPNIVGLPLAEVLAAIEVLG